MSKVFSKSKQEEGKNTIEILYENSTVMDKLDFNIDFLNAYLVKAINNFLNSRYEYNIKLCEKYLSSNCKNELIEDINKDAAKYNLSNCNIEIKSIEILSQNIQSVNYISDLIIEIKTHANYHKENIITKIIREVDEEYVQKLWFSLGDGKGWVINKYYNRDYAYSNDDKIIRM